MRFIPLQNTTNTMQIKLTPTITDYVTAVLSGPGHEVMLLRNESSGQFSVAIDVDHIPGGNELLVINESRTLTAADEKAELYNDVLELAVDELRDLVENEIKMAKETAGGLTFDEMLDFDRALFHMLDHAKSKGCGIFSPWTCASQVAGTFDLGLCPEDHEYLDVLLHTANLCDFDRTASKSGDKKS